MDAPSDETGFVELSASSSSSEDGGGSSRSADMFTDLDGAFINFNEGIETMRFSGTDVSIKYNFDLPIQVTIPGSTVLYEFETDGGDIEFSISFIPNDTRIAEEVLTMSRVPSDIEPIKGHFRTPSEGVIMFKWNNDYSWIAYKNLSYMIELSQPSFATADRARCMKAKSMLQALLADSKKSEIQLASTQATASSLLSDITSISEELKRLSTTLSVKQAAFRAAEINSRELSTRLVSNNLKKAGLCIRMLDKSLLMKVFSMTTSAEQAKLRRVCKYWNTILRSKK